MALKRRRNDNMWKEFYFYFVVILSCLLYPILFATSEPVCYTRVSLDERNRYMKSVDCNGTDKICHRFASSEDVKLGALLDSPCGYPEDYPFTTEKPHKAITCSTINLPTVTEGSFDCAPNKDVSMGEACALSCNSGFHAAYSNQVVCEAEASSQEGKWSEGTFVCRDITCQDVHLPTVKSGFFICSGFSVGDKCTLICDYHYYPSATKFAVCEEYDDHKANWTAGKFQCSGITCSTNNLPIVGEGSFDCAPNTVISKGKACTLTCNDGFYPAYSSQALCEEETAKQGGVWSDGNFVCRRVECNEWNEWNGSEYKLTSTSQPWEESSQLCESDNSHLVTIENNEKNEFVHMVWRCYQYLYQSAWIGLNDRTTEGTWEWIDGAVSTYINWRDGEPNGEVHANCVYIYGGNGKWYDWDCNRNLPAVCERHSRQ